MGRKISQFPAASTINDADVLAGVQGTSNKKFSFALIWGYINGKLGNTFVPQTRTINNKALTSDIALDASDVGAVATSAVGAADGVASLDSNGKVPPSQLPPISSDAEDITYDPTASGASATNVQDALDEAFDDLDGKQSAITASGILKGDGQGGVTAATPGTDYQAPLTIDATPKANSTNPVQSGGVYTDVRTRVPVNGMGKNLLDNWYFLNPVNQRGQTSGAAGYSIDRWNASFGSGGVSWSLTSSGLTFQPTNPSSYGYICQVIDNEILSALTGKRISVYVLTSTGDMLGGLVPYTSNVLIYDATYDGHRVRIRFVGSEIRIESYASALTVCAVKLELGTEQTLCHNEGTDANPVWALNEVPDYEYELFRCMTSTADSTDTYANKTLATGEELAYVENGTTASRAYAVGEYFCRHGLLYRAKTAIGNGDTFTENTNCEQVTEGGLNDVNSIVMNDISFNSGYSATSGETAQYGKTKNGIVIVSGLIRHGSTDITPFEPFTLPEGYRPKYSVTFLGENSNHGYVVMGSIGPDGVAVFLSMANTFASGASFNTGLAFRDVYFEVCYKAAN